MNHRILRSPVWGCLLASLVLLPACAGNVPPPAEAPAAPATIGKRTKSSGCVVQGNLPDPGCTPGAILATATKEQICVPGYSKNVRDVSRAQKNRVFAAYGVTEHKPGEYEVDHLIPLGLGGSNALANLWPQAAEPRPGFHEKDKVENYLRDQVCSGAISLQQAQAQISGNWIAVYNNITKNH